MIYDILFSDFAEDWFGYKPRIAGISKDFPHTMFLGRYPIWRSISALWGFEEEIEFGVSVITHETIHLIIHTFRIHRKSEHEGFDKICKKLLNSKLSIMRLGAPKP